MSYRIHTTAQAEADIERIFTWLAERSPQGAARWYESFWDAAERLREFPHLSTLAREAKDFPEELRCLFFGTTRGRTYRALFAIRDDVVHILCIRGPGQKPVKAADIDQ
jgi:plasmid stabilization system protein ParE